MQHLNIERVRKKQALFPQQLIEKFVFPFCSQNVAQVHNVVIYGFNVQLRMLS